MSTISLRLPQSLHKEIKRLTKEEGISINQFIVMAAAEKIAALETETYIAQRAQRANQERFLEVMEKVPDVDPEIEEDRID
jgi:uncharacterized protein (DUF1778 family)